MKILEEFWYGNLHPGQRDMKPDSSMGRAAQRVADCENKLMLLLSDEAKKAFELLQINQRELLCISETEAFVLGYKLGAKMAYAKKNGGKFFPPTVVQRAQSPDLTIILADCCKKCKSHLQENDCSDSKVSAVPTLL